MLDYAVSPSGRAIAYAQETDTGAANLWVIDLITRTRAPITDCVAAICRAPAWSADGQRIAYQRAELDPDRGAGNGPARAWIVDLATLQPSLLFEDEQALGASPIWSPDGARVAAFDATIPGIRVRDFSGGAGVRIESLEGTAGLFSPDGARLLVPVLVRGALGEAFYTQLELVDLAQGERARVSGDVDAPIEDTGAVLAAGWRRADRPAALPGRPFHAGATDLPARSGKRRRRAAGSRPAYTHSALGWTPPGRGWSTSGSRSACLPDAEPEIWTLDLISGARAQVASDAFLPAWVP